MTPQQFEIMQIAYGLASEHIMGQGKFNSQTAADSLRIFIGATSRKVERDAAQAVLDALDYLDALNWADHRARCWQDRKLLVLEAFATFDGIFDQNISRHHYVALACDEASAERPQRKRGQ
ncbi:hypothetical protein AAAK29_29825 [Mesorhizobium sp. CCNWLW179-1]|uniref:hypothetical protein n=1 Tax=unclassified Mesorhizobium TaxID=325217 RepID=UPI003014B29A